MKECLFALIATERFRSDAYKWRWFAALTTALRMHADGGAPRPPTFGSLVDLIWRQLTAHDMHRNALLEHDVDYLHVFGGAEAVAIPSILLLQAVERQVPPEVRVQRDAEGEERLFVGAGHARDSDDVLAAIEALSLGEALSQHTVVVDVLWLAVVAQQLAQAALIVELKDEAVEHPSLRARHASRQSERFVAFEDRRAAGRRVGVELQSLATWGRTGSPTTLFASARRAWRSLAAAAAGPSCATPGAPLDRGEPGVELAVVWRSTPPLDLALEFDARLLLHRAPRSLATWGRTGSSTMLLACIATSKLFAHAA